MGFKPLYTPGRYFSPPIGSYDTPISDYPNNRISFIPMFLAESKSIDSIAFSTHSNNPVGTTIRVSTFTNVNGKPGVQIADFGQVSFESARTELILPTPSNHPTQFFIAVNTNQGNCRFWGGFGTAFEAGVYRGSDSLAAINPLSTSFGYVLNNFPYGVHPTTIDTASVNFQNSGAIYPIPWVRIAS